MSQVRTREHTNSNSNELRNGHSLLPRKGGGGGEKVVSLGDFVCASKKMQIHTNKIFDLRKYITYRLREMYHFYVCFSDGNHLTGDVHSAWTACVSGTTRRA